MQSKNAKPASLNKSMASCLPPFGSPKRMSKLAVGIPLAFMHRDTHPSPEKTSMKLYSWMLLHQQIDVIQTYIYHCNQNSMAEKASLFEGSRLPVLAKNMHASVAGQQQHARHQHLPKWMDSWVFWGGFNSSMTFELLGYAGSCSGNL